MLLIVSLIVPFIFLIEDTYLYRKSLFWAILFNTNNYFSSLDNYFGASSSENPILHTWTLAIEMQFYLVLPLIIMIFKRKVLLIRIIVSIIILLLLYSTYYVKAGDSAGMYFSLLSRMPEFLLGVLVAVINLRENILVKKYSFLFSSVGMLILLICAFQFNELTPFPGVISMIPCIGTILILISSSNKINDLLSQRILVFIGEISYSIYLWHWPIMALIRYNNEEYDLSIKEKVFVIIITSVFSLISYFFIEKFLRNQKKMRFYYPFLILSVSTGLMVVLTIFFSKRINHSYTEYFNPHFGLKSHGSTFINVETFGDTTTNKSEILLVGDSHAFCMKKYMDVLGNKNNFSVKAITNDVYPTIPGLSKIDFIKSKFFISYNKLIPYVEEELGRNKLIIILFTSDGAKWINSIKLLLNNLKPNQKVIFLADFPVLEKNPVRANKTILKSESKQHNFKVLKNKISDSLLKIILEDKRCKFLDLSNSKVFDDVPFYKDTLMYYDSNHLNIYGSKVYGLETEDKFMEAIKWGLSIE